MILGLIIGFIAGFIVGMLYYKNNVTKATALLKAMEDAKNKAEAELQKLKG